MDSEQEKKSSSKIKKYRICLKQSVHLTVEMWSCYLVLAETMWKYSLDLLPASTGLFCFFFIHSSLDSHLSHRQIQCTLNDSCWMRSLYVHTENLCLIVILKYDVLMLNCRLNLCVCVCVYTFCCFTFEINASSRLPLCCWAVQT